MNCRSPEGFRFPAGLIFLTFLFTFLLLPSAFAIGISPARIDIPFKPNLDSVYEFTVMNNVGIPISVEVYKAGNLSDYITILNPEKFDLGPGQTKTLSFRLALPADLGEPGKHEGRIGALEGIPLSEGGGAQLGARAAVEMQVWVRVPYPGKYAQVSINGDDSDIGKPVNFVVTVMSLGTEDIKVSDEIEIYENKTKITNIKASPSLSLKSGESGKMYASWIGQKAGQYKAVAIVSYDGKKATSETTFRVGQLVLEIVSMPKVIVQEGQIAELKPTVVSRWNSIIKGVYADVDVIKAGKVVAKGRSETFDVRPWESKTFSAFVKTEDLSIGLYDVKLTVYYADKTESRLFPAVLEVTKPITIPHTELIYIIVLVMTIIIILVIAIIILIRTKKPRKNMKKQKNKRKK